MKTTTSIKLDKEVKEKAHELAYELGISLSTLINAQLKQFVRDRKLVLADTPQMSYYLEELLGPIEKDIKEKKNIIGSASSKKELDSFFESL